MLGRWGGALRWVGSWAWLGEGGPGFWHLQLGGADRQVPVMKGPVALDSLQTYRPLGFAGKQLSSVIGSRWGFLDLSAALKAAMNSVP